MLEIAELYEHLAERTRQLEQLGVTAEVNPSLSEQRVSGLAERLNDRTKPMTLDQPPL